MAKDMQYAKFWRAVRENPAYKERCAEVPEIQKWLKRVTTYATLTSRYPVLTRFKFVAGDGRGGGAKAQVRGDEAMICCDRDHREKATILWVLAKFIDRRVNSGLKDRMPHGWSMCAIYVDLIRYTMGKEASDILKASFAAHKVRWKKPVVRMTEPSEAQLQARRIFAIKRKLYAKPNPESLKG